MIQGLEKTSIGLGLSREEMKPFKKVTKGQILLSTFFTAH